MSRCKDTGLMGPRCESEEGHAGSHTHTYPTGRTVTWTDEGTRRAVNDWERRGGGWD